MVSSELFVEVFGPPKTRSTSGIDFDKYDAIPVQAGASRDICKFMHHVYMYISM